MVARSANARATSASRSPIGASSILKRFKAPKVVSRRRSGSASADRNPAAAATFEKWGQGPDPGRRLSIEELCTRGMQSQSSP